MTTVPWVAILAAIVSLLAYLAALVAIALYSTGWLGVVQLLVVGVLGRNALARVNG